MAQKPLTTHVAAITEAQTGGNCMVSLVTLADGRVLGINDECVVLYRSMDDFENDMGDVDRPAIDLCEGA